MERPAEGESGTWDRWILVHISLAAIYIFVEKYYIRDSHLDY
jgi:hypothetical protein